jgi:hypothetical protein
LQINDTCGNDLVIWNFLLWKGLGSVGEKSKVVWSVFFETAGEIKFRNKKYVYIFISLLQLRYKGTKSFTKLFLVPK